MKAIIFLPDVIRTAATDAVIERLDQYAAEAGITLRITSVKRTPESQLRAIQDYAQERKIILDGQGLDLVTVMDYLGESIPYWQLVWSRLLSAGVIVNPPRAAKVLTDYWRNGVNKKGLIIQPSTHIISDKAFDIGGRYFKAGNLVNDVDTVYAVTLKAAKNNIGIRLTESSPLIEHGNNCVHCNTL